MFYVFCCYCIFYSMACQSMLFASPSKLIKAAKFKRSLESVSEWMSEKQKMNIKEAETTLVVNAQDLKSWP